MERSVKGIEVATRDRARLLAHNVREQLTPVTEGLFWNHLGLFAGLAAITILSVHVALTGTLPAALLSAGCALASAGALGWLLSTHLAALQRQRASLVKRAFFEHYAASEADSNERALFLRELDAATRWQLRAQLRGQRLPLVEFLPAWTGNFWPTVSFTVGHFAIAASIVWWYTGSWALGGQVALIEPIVNGFWHYANAHLWQSGKSDE
ncbi:MAG: DUF2061 domain-containing protein [Myxococcales bacterium]|nr:DUF2061 domain-containing protein [Myxococcales bacterium]